MNYDRWAAGIEAPRALWSERRAERVGIAQAHHEIYQAVLQ
jgi:hypothetical protein